MPVITTLGALSQFKFASTTDQFFIVQFEGNNAPVVNNKINILQNNSNLYINGQNFGANQLQQLNPFVNINLANFNVNFQTYSNITGIPSGIIKIGNADIGLLRGNIFSQVSNGNSYISNINANYNAGVTNSLFSDTSNIFIVNSSNIAKYNNSLTMINRVRSGNGVNTIRTSQLDNGNIILGYTTANSNGFIILDIDNTLSNINYQNRIRITGSLTIKLVEKNLNDYYFIASNANSYIGKCSGNSLNWSKQHDLSSNRQIIGGTIFGDNFYILDGSYPDGNNYITCFNKDTGNIIWSRQLFGNHISGNSDYFYGLAINASVNGLLITGTLSNDFNVYPSGSSTINLPLNGAVPGTGNYNLSNYNYFYLDHFPVVYSNANLTIHTSNANLISGNIANTSIANVTYNSNVTFTNFGTYI